MSKHKSTFKAGHYKIAGSELPGQDVVPELERQQFARQKVEEQWPATHQQVQETSKIPEHSHEGAEKLENRKMAKSEEPARTSRRRSMTAVVSTEREAKGKRARRIQTTPDKAARVTTPSKRKTRQSTTAHRRAA